jgi:hypothetical protein
MKKAARTRKTVIVIFKSIKPKAKQPQSKYRSGVFSILVTQNLCVLFVDHIRLFFPTGTNRWDLVKISSFLPFSFKPCLYKKKSL